MSNIDYLENGKTYSLGQLFLSQKQIQSIAGIVYGADN